MISYPVYKLLHYFGLFLVVTALSGGAFAAIQGQYLDHPWRKKAAMIHGIGLFLVLLGGFGMLARLGITDGLPGWIHLKLGLWAGLAALMIVVKRIPKAAAIAWAATIALAWLAGYVALYKPL